MQQRQLTLAWHGSSGGHHAALQLCAATLRTSSFLLSDDPDMSTELRCAAQKILPHIYQDTLKGDARIRATSLLRAADTFREISPLRSLLRSLCCGFAAVLPLNNRSPTA